DAPAKKWLDDGAARHDVRLLERVVNEAFCSRPAEQALQTLGDLAFERGEFESAQRWWRLLAPPGHRSGPAGKFELTCSDPSDAGALARAKQILGTLYQGDKTQAKEELEAFRGKHAEAAGMLAGRPGKYGDTLSGLISTKDRFALAASAQSPSTWNTFAG